MNYIVYNAQNCVNYLLANQHVKYDLFWNIKRTMETLNIMLKDLLPNTREQ
jgi:hypothetical protein